MGAIMNQTARKVMVNQTARGDHEEQNYLWEPGLNNLSVVTLFTAKNMQHLTAQVTTVTRT